MKRSKKVLLCLFLFFLLGCNAETEMTYAIPYQIIETDTETFLELLYNRLSPNSEWYVDANYSPTSIMLYSFQNIDDHQELELPAEILSTHLNIDVFAWSPESDAFLVGGMGPQGTHSNVAIVTLTDGIAGNPQLIDFSPEVQDASFFSWSTDNNTLAILRYWSDVPGDVFIEFVNREGDMTNEVELQLGGDGTSYEISMIGENIILKQSGESEDRYFSYNPDSNPVPELIFEDERRFTFNGFTPDYQDLILSYNDRNNYSTTFYTLNIEDGTLRTLFQVSDVDIWAYRQPFDRNSLGIVGINNQIKYLFIWDFNNNVLTNEGEINRLVGWSSEYYGYLVVNLDEAGDYFFEIIQP